MDFRENNALETKKFILDYSKWRCGGDKGNNIVGIGNTELINDEGFMCCLGQCSLQVGIPENIIKNFGEPHEITTEIPVFNIVDKEEYEDEEPEIVGVYNTNLSYSAVSINDDENTTPAEKIVKLKELFAEEGYELEVINQPV